ncbi:MAG TPA: tetratricopeptide repeat protein [Gemmataceae bacterium]|nr:tetratricopeptide repeat protein [Gemmataceae bacterium]
MVIGLARRVWFWSAAARRRSEAEPNSKTRSGVEPPHSRFVPILLSIALLAVIGTGVTIAGWQGWAWYHYRAALRALERRDLSLAQAQLNSCLKVWPTSAEVHLLAARTARRIGAYDDAELHLKECQLLGWPIEELSLERDLALAQRGDLAEVEEKLVRFAEHDHPDRFLILEALAQGYIKTYRLSQALHCLELWLKRRPNDVQALVWRAEVEQLRSSTSEALADYRRVVALEPERDQARLRLAELLATEHQPAEAVSHFEHLRQRQPTNPGVLLGLARCRHLLGESTEAARLLDTLLERSPDDATALGERGRLFLEIGQFGEAERWLRRAADRAPYDRDIVYPLYLCLQQSGKSEAAEAYRIKLQEIDAQLSRLRELTRQIVQMPHDPALRHEAGMIFLTSGQAKEGLRWLYSALQEDPRYEPAHRLLADYYDRVGNQGLAGWHRRQIQN